MRTTVLSMICVLAIVSAATAYDLPEVIGEFRPEDENTRYAQQFCCIGDQNGDGRDDLILSAFDYRRYEIFLGKDSMGGEYNYTIPLIRGEREEVREVLWIGNLMPNLTNVYATHNFNRADTMAYLDFYNGVGEPEDHLFAVWGAHFGRDGSRRIFDGTPSRPFDFNSDGYDDFLCFQEVVDTIGAMQIYYGGEDFDSIPDWQKHFTYIDRGLFGGLRYVGGYDVNRDGHQDILLRGRGFHEGDIQAVFYSIYLGGDPPDTIPSFVLWDRTFEGRMQPTHMDGGFTMLPDVNDDGYADFAIYWDDSWPVGDHGVARSDGIYLFFGGEEVDAEPDMILPGATQGCSSACDLTGGDFNGDGKGDIFIYYGSNSPPGFDELNFHFGSRWFDTEPDLIVSGSDYDNEYGFLLSNIGAVGDYNGDGVDDVVVSTSGEIELIILAGSREWQLDVPDDPANPVPETFDFHLRTFPNPFNSMTHISFNLREDSHIKLTIHDIQGREVAVLRDGSEIAGVHNVSWDASELASGVYICRLQVGDKTSVIKMAMVR